MYKIVQKPVDLTSDEKVETRLQKTRKSFIISPSFNLSQINIELQNIHKQRYIKRGKYFIVKVKSSYICQ